MHAPRGRRRYHQIPSGFENPARAHRLPEGDVELASRRPAPQQSSHDHALAHHPYYPMTFLPDAARRHFRRRPSRSWIAVILGPRLPCHFAVTENSDTWEAGELGSSSDPWQGIAEKSGVFCPIRLGPRAFVWAASIRVTPPFTIELDCRIWVARMSGSSTVQADTAEPRTPHCFRGRPQQASGWSSAGPGKVPQLSRQSAERRRRQEQASDNLTLLTVPADKLLRWQPSRLKNHILPGVRTVR